MSQYKGGRTFILGEAATEHIFIKIVPRIVRGSGGQDTRLRASRFSSINIEMVYQQYCFGICVTRRDYKREYRKV